MRTFPHRSAQKRKAIGIALALGAIGLGGVGVLLGSEPNAAKANEQAAANILEAAEKWRTENGVGCPTVSVLKSDRHLGKDAPADDTWGEHFRVLCTSGGITVRSAGPDKLLNTDDDVKLGSSPS